MANFQVTIVEPKDLNSERDPARHDILPTDRGAERVMDRIDALGTIWDQVIARLTELATKGEASVSITFTRT